jgi:formylmethanofuran dehydrogenase subunit E
LRYPTEMDGFPRSSPLALSDSSKDMITDNFVLKERDNDSEIQFEDNDDDDPIILSQAPSAFDLMEVPSKTPSSVDVFSTECNDCEERLNLGQVCSNTPKNLKIAIFKCSAISTVLRVPCR